MAAFIIFALVLTSGIFFKIKDIRVEGVSVVSALDVAELSGISENDNIFLINKNTAAHNLKSRFPYVKAVRIKRELPSRVVIIITEAEQTGIISHRDSDWLFDQHGSLLEPVSSAKMYHLPVIKGIELLEPVAGTKLDGGEGGAAKVEPMLDLLNAMRDEGIIEDVGEIDLTRLSNITFTYKGEYKAELGAPDSFHRKISVMLLALQDPAVADKGGGTFNLAGAEGKKVIFQPDVVG